MAIHVQYGNSSIGCNALLKIYPPRATLRTDFRGRCFLWLMISQREKHSRTVTSDSNVCRDLPEPRSLCIIPELPPTKCRSVATSLPATSLINPLSRAQRGTRNVSFSPLPEMSPSLGTTSDLLSQLSSPSPPLSLLNLQVSMRLADPPMQLERADSGDPETIF